MSSLVKRVSRIKPAVIVAAMALLMGGFLLASGAFDAPAGPPAPSVNNTTVVASAPACPGNVTAVATGNNTIRLTWEPSPNASQYRVSRAEGSGPFVDTHAIILAPDTTFEDTVLSHGVTYRYRVIAENAAGSSVGCSEVEATAIPEFPTLAVGAIALVGGVAAYAMLRRTR